MHLTSAFSLLPSTDGKCSSCSRNSKAILPITKKFGDGNSCTGEYLDLSFCNPIGHYVEPASTVEATQSHTVHPDQVNNASICGSKHLMGMFRLMRIGPANKKSGSRP